MPINLQEEGLRRANEALAMPILQLTQRIDESDDDADRELYTSVLTDKATELADAANTLEGSEQVLAFAAELQNQGEVPEDFIDQVMSPIYIAKTREQALKPISLAEDAENLIKAIPEVAADLGQGIKGLAENLVPGVIGAVGGVLEDAGLGLTTPEQKQSAEFLGAAAEQGTRETARLAVRGGRKLRNLFTQRGLAPEGLTMSDAELRARFKQDLPGWRRQNLVETGQRDIGLVASLLLNEEDWNSRRDDIVEANKTRAEAGKEELLVPPDWAQLKAGEKAKRPQLSEEQVKQIPGTGEFLDASNFIPFGLGVKAVAAPAKVVASRLLTTAAESAAKKTTEAAAKRGVVRTVAGKAVDVAADATEKVAGSPVLRGTAAALTVAATGANPATAIIAGMLGTGRVTRAIAKVVPDTLRSVSKAVKTPFTGPIGFFTQRAKDTGKASLWGTAGMIPLAAAAETSEERGALLAGGVIYGGAGGAAASTVNGIHSLGNSFWSPTEDPQNVVRAKGSTYNTIYDVQHNKAAVNLSNADHNRVEALRDMIRPTSDLYVLGEAEFNALPIDKVEGAQGVTNIPLANGRNATFVKLGGNALSHEVGHVILKGLPEADRTAVTSAVVEAYSTDDLAKMKANYEKALKGKTLSFEELVDEIAAENFQAVLGGLPVDKMGTPPSLATQVYTSVGRLAERIGLRDLTPGGQVVTSEALEYTPSFLVRRALENSVEAFALSNAAETVGAEGLQAPEDASGAVTPGTTAQTVETEASDGLSLIPSSPTDGVAPVSDVDVGASVPVPAELTVDPQSPFNPAGVTGEAPITAEAKAILDLIDDGGAAPAFVTKRLEKIARDNGITVLPRTTPDEIVQLLREQHARSGLGPATEAAPVAVAPAVPPLHATEAQRATLGAAASEETQTSNIGALQAEVAKAQADRVPQQLDYNSAKVDEAEGTRGLTEPERLEQRRLADAGEQEGVANPLRALYDKVTIPLRVAVNNKNGKATVFGFSFDKFIRNTDMMGAWLSEHPDVAQNLFEGTGYSSLADPKFVEDVQTYFENQANGYRGDGGAVVLPVDTIVGTFPIPNPEYVPTVLDPKVVGIINTLIGVKNVANWGPNATLKQSYIKRLAEANGLGVAEIEEAKSSGSKPKEGFNEVKASLRAATFDPNLLHVTTEQLRIDRMATPIRPRPDLVAIKAPVGGFAQAGFLPSPPTESKAFKTWFGDSKVVDEEGDPKVMYHGTDSNFTTFRSNRRGAHFFSPIPEFADGFAVALGGDTTGGNVLPVFLKAENPFDYENPAHTRRLLDTPFAKKRVAAIGDSYASDIEEGDWSVLEHSIRDLKQLGHDSVYVQEQGFRNLGVFEPTQVKSATGNQGTFDSANPDIRFMPSLVLNVGLERPDGGVNTEADVIAAIEAEGGEATEGATQQSNSEPTFVVSTSPLSETQVHNISEALGQQAIAAFDPSTQEGFLAGPEKELWGDFSLDFFLLPLDDVRVHGPLSDE